MTGKNIFQNQSNFSQQKSMVSKKKPPSNNSNPKGKSLNILKFKLTGLSLKSNRNWQITLIFASISAIFNYDKKVIEKFFEKKSMDRPVVQKRAMKSEYKSF